MTADYAQGAKPRILFYISDLDEDHEYRLTLESHR
jgi:hypothetical protein